MAISIINALDLIYTTVTPLPSEVIPIEDGIGRVLSIDYIANSNLPRFDNSAMDGYAVKLADAGREIESHKVIYAGDKEQYELKDGEAIRIMTGAAIPDGCEAIVPIEDVEYIDGGVKLPDNIVVGKHIRRAGEDMKSGSIYLKAGEEVTAYAIALFASQGVTHISVVRRVKVAVFGTGDELRPHYEQIEAHQLYNSNAPMFLARARELGCEVIYIGGSGDTIESLKLSISKALSADLIITSGGVSVGDKDFTKEAFAQLGMEVIFSGVDIKPGKPTTIGKIGESFVVNLPGNPLASMVNYEIFIRAIISKLSGKCDYYHNTIDVKMSSDYGLRAGKYTVVLGSFDGRYFTPLAQQSPGMVSPLPRADGMIVVEPTLSMLQRNKTVKMIPIKWELNSCELVDIFTS